MTADIITIIISYSVKNSSYHSIHNRSVREPQCMIFVPRLHASYFLPKESPLELNYTGE